MISFCMRIHHISYAYSGYTVVNYWFKNYNASACLLIIQRLQQGNKQLHGENDTVTVQKQILFSNIYVYQFW